MYIIFSGSKVFWDAQQILTLSNWKACSSYEEASRDWIYFSFRFFSSRRRLVWRKQKQKNYRNTPESIEMEEKI